MEALFENKFTRDAEWAKDHFGYMYIRRPLLIFMEVVAALCFAWLVYDLIVNSVINVLLLLYFVFWGVMPALLYRKNSEMALKRDFEIHGRTIEVVTTVTNKGIEISQSTGALYRLSFSDMKKVVQTKKFIYLWSKTNTLYSIKKDSFSVGNTEDFLLFMRNKGIR